MKRIKLILLSATTLTTLLISNYRVQAADFALSLGELVTPPPDTSISGLCSNLQQCQPEDVITVSVPEGTSSRYVKNDTTFNVTKATYTILSDQDVFWNPASKFSFFQKQEISLDGKVLTFSDGAFLSGATALFTRTGNVPVKITVSFQGQPKSQAVVEPSIILGLLTISTLSLLLKNQDLQKI
ncbi:hypothetical protein H6G91_35205 [Nostoc muscorum FACHB-395]|nr:hypothetical protein [Desmonostoc muscorum FACHB-395]